MDKAQRIRLVYPLIQEWLGDYQGGIIESLKACRESEVMDLRNRLVASEVFKDWLQSKLFDGKQAEEILAQLDSDENIPFDYL